MNKRDFLRYSALGIAGSSILSPSTLLSELPNPKGLGYPQQIIKPRKPKQGENVLLVAPGTNVSDPILLNKAKKIIESFGFKAIIDDSINDTKGYLTKDSSKRAEAVNNGFRNDSISAIWCIRGGYGSMDILDKLDYDIIKANPKPFIGYSDITALHNAIYINTGLITFHGPVGLSEMTEYTYTELSKILTSGKKGDTIDLRPKQNGQFESLKYTVNANRNSEGRLLGGNLSLVTALVGTPYLPNYSASIVYLEDVGEQPYRIHRMLKQLELSGAFEANQGIIFGKCDDCGKSKAHVSDYTENEVYLDIASRLDSPVTLNNLIGHTKDQTTLPNGAFVRFYPNEYTIELLEDIYS